MLNDAETFLQQAAEAMKTKDPAFENCIPVDFAEGRVPPEKL
jgi:hypothetical protein